MSKILDRIKEKPRILVVDDRETEREILTNLLSKFDAEIHTASSGQEALTKLIRYNFVLVLLDIQMPIMDGLETARLMRSNKSTENVPIIFLTAYDKDEITMLQGYKVGAIDYLFKPINKEILLSKVQTFLRSYSFEKEKEYEKILAELEKQNKKLKVAEKEAREMAEEAFAAKKEAEESAKKVERQAEELLRTNKELERFAHVTSKELRGPIINMNSLLKIFSGEDFSPDENQLIVSKIYNAVNDINNTLYDLIEMVEHRKALKDEAKKIKFEKLIAEILQELQPQIAEKKVKITYDFEKVPSINYIPEHIRSILYNLISNAIKYSSDKRDSWVNISTAPKNGGVTIKVEDNGIGIETKNQEKIFGLFWKLNSKEKEKGMGLYITRSNVESMGGKINFESEPDQGTTFYVHLKNLTLKEAGEKQLSH